jgi:hypothetical protein
MEFKVYGRENMSSGPIIGTVLVELSTYLGNNSKEEIKFDCQYPIFDQTEGIRGELFLKFKIKLVIDENELKNMQAGNEDIFPQNNAPRLTSSLMINFFSSMSPPDPSLYDCTMIGFVEELSAVNSKDKVTDYRKTIVQS